FNSARRFPHRFLGCQGTGTRGQENGVRDVSVWGALLVVEKTISEQGGVRRGRRDDSGPCTAEQPAAWPLRGMPTAEPSVRLRRGPTLVAVSGPRDGTGSAGSRCPAGSVPPARGGRRRG